jgi:chromosome segregation ATPase
MFLMRVVGLLALVFGLVGVTACGAGAYGVRQAQLRLNRANEKVFDAVDRGFAAVQERIPAVQERVKQAKITTDDLSDALRGWATKEARERVTAKLEIDLKAEKLAGHLNAVDSRLEASTIAVRDVRQLLEVGQNLGASVDPSSTDEVLELLASLRGSLSEAQQTVDEVRKFAGADRETVEEKLIRFAKLIVRILATISDVNSRLDRLATRLAELRTEAQQLKAKTSDYILWGAVACYALLVWIAAGQVALGRWGWSRLWRRRAPSAPVAG